MPCTFFRVYLSKTKRSIWLWDPIHNLRIKFEFYPDNIIIKVTKDNKLIGFARLGCEWRRKFAKLFEFYDGVVPIDEFFRLVKVDEPGLNIDEEDEAT